jgi:hypothetical protein
MCLSALMALGLLTSHAKAGDYYCGDGYYGSRSYGGPYHRGGYYDHGRPHCRSSS